MTEPEVWVHEMHVFKWASPGELQGMTRGGWETGESRVMSVRQLIVESLQSLPTEVRAGIKAFLFSQDFPQNQVDIFFEYRSCACISGVTATVQVCCILICGKII